MSRDCQPDLNIPISSCSTMIFDKKGQVIISVPDQLFFQCTGETTSRALIKSFWFVLGPLHDLKILKYFVSATRCNFLCAVTGLITIIHDQTVKKNGSNNNFYLDTRTILGSKKVFPVIGIEEVVVEAMIISVVAVVAVEVAVAVAE